VAAVLVLAVVAAAVGGSWRLQPPDWVLSGQNEPLVPLPVPTVPEFGPTVRPNVEGDPLDVSWLAPLAIVLAVLAVAALMWWLWLRYQRSAVEQRTARQVSGALVLPSTPEVPVLRQGVAAAQRHLDQIADPNNAIVAAWLALEAAASSSGVHREPAETPTEFTVDVLAATAADPAATRELLALYHRARFSAAGVTRADVSAASRCLVVLAVGWEALRAEAVTPGASGPDGASSP
jgi:Domain of unknown function (DUF4129)